MKNLEKLSILKTVTKIHFLGQTLHLLGLRKWPETTKQDEVITNLKRMNNSLYMNPYLTPQYNGDLDDHLDDHLGDHLHDHPYVHLGHLDHDKQGILQRSTPGKWLKNNWQKTD